MHQLYSLDINVSPPLTGLGIRNPGSVIVRCKVLVTNFGGLVLGCIEALYFYIATRLYGVIHTSMSNSFISFATQVTVMSPTVAA